MHIISHRYEPIKRWIIVETVSNSLRVSINRRYDAVNMLNSVVRLFETREAAIKYSIGILTTGRYRTYHPKSFSFFDRENMFICHPSEMSPPTFWIRKTFEEVSVCPKTFEMKIQDIESIVARYTGSFARPDKDALDRLGAPTYAYC